MNVIVRVLTRKAVGKAMKSARKSMGGKKSKHGGGTRRRPKNRDAKHKKRVD